VSHGKPYDRGSSLGDVRLAVVRAAAEALEGTVLFPTAKDVDARPAGRIH
jgi:hypothetical protein